MRGGPVTPEQVCAARSACTWTAIQAPRAFSTGCEAVAAVEAGWTCSAFAPC
jgi:hypothetical protein